ncbi:MAG: esterase, partial [Bacteroidales bacterium]|nr:esterase [Bacteroidales bacterium]
PGILTDTKKFNSQRKVVYISCGEQDPRITYNKAVVKTMQDAGVNVVFNSFPGDHEWQPWRKSIRDFAQKLFK